MPTCTPKYILICVLYNLTNYLPQEGHLLRERRGEHPVGKICDATLFMVTTSIPILNFCRQLLTPGKKEN
jgi:hypothetical protein